MVLTPLISRVQSRSTTGSGWANKMKGTSLLLPIRAVVVVVVVVVVVDDDDGEEFNILFYCIANIILMYRIEE